jgi:hypothetical protein
MVLGPMDAERCWELIESARAEAGPIGDDIDDRLADSLIELLVRLPLDDIVAFELRFSELQGRLFDREDVYAAAFLVQHGCGDDSFSDFRAAMVGLGRHWYERVLADPDHLALHPAVQAIAAGTIDQSALLMERFQYAATHAYKRVTGDDSGMYHALAYAEQDKMEDEAGDADNEPRLLPRLAELFPAAQESYARFYLD